MISATLDNSEVDASEVKDQQCDASNFWILGDSSGISWSFQQQLTSRLFKQRGLLMDSGRDIKLLCDTLKSSSFGKISRITWRSSSIRLAFLKYNVLKFGQPFAIECLSLNLLNDSPSREHPEIFNVTSFGNKKNFVGRSLSPLQNDMSIYSSPIRLPMESGNCWIAVPIIWIFNGLSIFCVTCGKCSSVLHKLKDIISKDGKYIVGVKLLSAVHSETLK